MRSAGKWSADLGGLLEEELLTGYVASASRALVAGRIELREPMWPWLRGFDVMRVGHEMSADSLVRAGFDVALPLRLRADEKLADCGATVVLSALPVPHGAVLGFRRAGHGSLRVDTDLLVQDLDAAAGKPSRG